MVKIGQRGIFIPRADRPATAKPLDWRRKMSDHIAYALLVYTVLQIFVTMGALKSEGGSLLPYLALIILVAAIIPVCRGAKADLEVRPTGTAATPARPAPAAPPPPPPPPAP